MEIKNLSIDALRHHPNNPRKDLGDLTELADSIKRSGIMQNLTVVDNGAEQLDVVIGNRRLEAAKLAGVEYVPCVIAEMSEAEQLATMLAENMQRADLTVYEQVQGIQLMLDIGESVESISKRTGISESTVRRRAKLGELDGDKLKAASERQVTFSDYESIFKIQDKEQRNKLLDVVGTKDFTFKLRQAEQAQENAEKIQRYRDEISKIGEFPEISEAERWSGKYSQIIGCVAPDTIVGKMGAEVQERRAADKDIKLFVFITPYSASLLVERGENGAFPAKPAAAIPSAAAPSADEGALKTARENEERRKCLEKVKEAERAAYKCRLDFMRYIPESMARRNTDTILKTLFELREEYDLPPDEAICEVFELDEYDLDQIKLGFSLEKWATLARFVYAIFQDNGQPHHCSTYGVDCGEYDPEGDDYFDDMMKYLESFGYEPSADEIALIDGSSELYYRKKD